MNTPEKNRISAVSFHNVEDSPVFQYINDLSPIEPVKTARPGVNNILHSLAFTSPSSLFSSPQINSYRDSRFSIKRHCSPDISSHETVKISGVNVSEKEQIKEEISLAIELANSLKAVKDECDIQMVNCDEVPMEVVGSVNQVKELSNPHEFGADSVQTEDIVGEIEPGLAHMTDPQEFSLCYNDSVEENGEIGLMRNHKQRSERRRCLTFDMGGGSNKRTPLRDTTNDMQDSPVSQYINDLSPIEPVKAGRPDNILQSLAFTSPSSLFSSPQINSYRDSRFSIKRHRSPDISSPLVCLGEYSETIKLENVSETKQIKEEISLAIELANSLKAGKDECNIQMIPMEVVNEEGIVGGSVNESIQLCRQPEFNADSVQTEDMEAEIESGLTDMQNDEQHDHRITSFASEPSLSSSSNVPAIDLTVKREKKEETGFTPNRKQRSVRRRCLTFDVGGFYKRTPLCDSTNDLPLDISITSINKISTTPQKLQDTDGVDIIPRKIDLHLNSPVVNPLFFQSGHVFSHCPIEDEYSTPVSTNRDSVSKAPESSMEEEEGFDKDMSTTNTDYHMQLTQGIDESRSCKRCKCRKSKCLKLYCDCFAAGLYCFEPCSCQECFNKPIHQDLVMKTREMIETRNPSAFASKLVSSFDSAGNSKKTPASARHTRGCNCKKSNCLKKYCECNLMGVGCSTNCRCIGCKNCFGLTNESRGVTSNDENEES